MGWTGISNWLGDLHLCVWVCVFACAVFLLVSFAGSFVGAFWGLAVAFSFVGGFLVIAILLFCALFLFFPGCSGVLGWRACFFGFLVASFGWWVGLLHFGVRGGLMCFLLVVFLVWLWYVFGCDLPLVGRVSIGFWGFFLCFACCVCVVFLCLILLLVL